mmetsp:Transcript_13181/g.23944  ORF Transcript_13181/g.23944 Transcript_13181/m.23944 type:complete len:324 (-) Transcript_13181:320-1291(-)
MLRKMTMHGKDINGNPFPPPLSEELCEDIGSAGEGISGDSNKECIRESRIRPANNGSLTYPTVSIDISNHNLAVGDDKKNSSTTTTSVSAPSILCLGDTLEDAHATRIRAIRELWAGGCDGFVAFSNRSDPRIPAISLEHEGPESYDNMWQKVRSIWRFVGIHYIQDYDWFYLGGGDLFLMPNNLKAYLASLAHKNESDPTTKEYYVGRRYNHKIRGPYNSGGPGYAISRATLVKFLAIIDNEKFCFANERTSAEDVMMGRCLGNLGINFVDTRDALKRERFHPIDPGWHYNWSPAQKQNVWWPKQQVGWEILQGKDCCAPDV